jgi:hypothetical protein
LSFVTLLVVVGLTSRKTTPPKELWDWFPEQSGKMVNRRRDNDDEVRGVAGHARESEGGTCDGGGCA